MQATVITVNAGSSSIKLGLFDADGGDVPIATSLLDRIGSEDAKASIKVADGPHEAIPLPAGSGRDHASGLAATLSELAKHAPAPIAALGHRIVHGGEGFSSPVLADDAVLEQLEKLVPLARSHQPHGLAGIRALRSQMPDLPQVCSFDTAFHATLPKAASTIALPLEIRSRGVRRYGFHGLSYQWAAQRLPSLLGEVSNGRVIVAHLGNGASLCGLVAGKSRATTMGFTPLDGLVMGERPGLTDPGAILFMFEEMGLSDFEVRDILFKRSGLLGLSGLSNDMRTLLASADPNAALAIEVYIHRIVREIGAIAAEIGGADALVFTGGVGENATEIRTRILEKLDWLGFADRDRSGIGDSPAPSGDDAKPVVVLPANEEAIIASDAREFVGHSGL
ncbi:MAG: acetate/propionate family kinase [Pseudomonadota bacterium]